MTDDIFSFYSDTFRAIETRRAVKHFDETHQFTDKEIKKLLSLAVLSPNSFNIQNRRFLVVKDAQIRKNQRSILESNSSNRIFSPFGIVCRS